MTYVFTIRFNYLQKITVIVAYGLKFHLYPPKEIRYYMKPLFIYMYIPSIRCWTDRHLSTR